MGKSARQDAIALLLADEQWNEAIPLLESYVKDYPQQANPEGKVISWPCRWSRWVSGKRQRNTLGGHSLFTSPVF